MKFRGRMKARNAPAVLGEPESGKTSQRLQLLMQRSLGGSEHRRWLRTRLKGSGERQKIELIWCLEISLLGNLGLPTLLFKRGEKSSR